MYSQPADDKCNSSDPSKNLWRVDSPYCRGGKDPGYVHPVNGSHDREPCKFYYYCQDVKTKGAQGALPPRPPQVLAPQQVQVRPPQQYQTLNVSPLQQPMPPRPAAIAPYQHQYIQQYQQQYPQQYQNPSQPGQFVHPWIAQNGPTYVPMQYQQPGSQIPSYLTIPEPVIAEEPWLWRLLREIFRSMMKSSGHSVASFFDHTPVKLHQPPEGPK